MTSRLSTKQLVRIEIQASKWVVKHEHPMWTVAQHEEFVKWYRESPYHRVVFHAIQVAWSRLSLVAGQVLLTPDERAELRGLLAARGHGASEPIHWEH